LVGNDGLGKPFWERKLIGDNTPIEDLQGKDFMGGSLKSWYRDAKKKTDSCGNCYQ
jgi:hypothetical protein